MPMGTVSDAPGSNRSENEWKKKERRNKSVSDKGTVCSLEGGVDEGKKKEGGSGDGG